MLLVLAIAGRESNPRTQRVDVSLRTGAETLAPMPNELGEPQMRGWGLTEGQLEGRLKEMPAASQYNLEDVKTHAEELSKENWQFEMWSYAQRFEATGEGAGSQAVRSAAEALLFDETKLQWNDSGSKDSRLRAHPRLAQAALDAISGSTAGLWSDRIVSVVADAHVLMYFLQTGDKDAQFHHISEATQLRPHHSRQWNLRSLTHIARNDWRTALKYARKSLDLATSDYDRWARQMNVVECLMKVTGVTEVTEVSEVTAAETVCPLPPLSLSVEAD